MVVQLTTLSLPTPVEVELGCDNIKFLKMEDYLNILVNGRKPQKLKSKRNATLNLNWL